MKAPRRAGPMSLEALEHWIDHAKPATYVNGVSMMDGFLAGVVVGPVFVSPQTWLWHLIGEQEERAYAGTKADAAVQAIVGHYNMIGQVLDQSPARYAPIFMRTDAGQVSAEHWANGFYGAMKLNILNGRSCSTRWRLQDLWRPFSVTALSQMDHQSTESGRPKCRLKCSPTPGV